jgi:hypothetical protein
VWGVMARKQCPLTLHSTAHSHSRDPFFPPSASSCCSSPLRRVTVCIVERRCGTMLISFLTCMGKALCHWCSRTQTQKTVLQHLHYRCTQGEWRQTLLQLAADAVLARLHRLATHPPRHCSMQTASRHPARSSHHYHRCSPPPGQPLRSSQANPQSPNPHSQDGNAHNAGSPGPHPNARFNTQGARPGPSTREHSPRFSPSPPPGDEAQPFVLEDVNLKLAGMDILDYINQTARAMLA